MCPFRFSNFPFKCQGVWGLFKYYIIPLFVYHFWASSFLKTSSLLQLLEIEQSDLVTLAYYKYPKWVEFLSLELNYAISSLHQFKRSFKASLGDNDDKKEVSFHSPVGQQKIALHIVYLFTALLIKNRADFLFRLQSSDKDEKKPTQKLSVIPFYNINEAYRYLLVSFRQTTSINSNNPFFWRMLKDSSSRSTKSISIRLKEFNLFNLLKCRFGGLISEGLLKDTTKVSIPCPLTYR